MITAHAFAKLLLAGPDVILVSDDDYRVRTLVGQSASVTEIYRSKSSGELSFYSWGDEFCDTVQAIVL